MPILFPLNRSGPSGGARLLSGPNTVQSPQGVVAEDSDDWWAGAQRCFVAIPLAGAVAAVALSASICFGLQQQTEEIVPQPAAAVSVSDGAVLPFQRPSFLITPWVAETECPVPAAATIVEDQSAPPLTIPSIRPAAFTPWVADDDLPGAHVVSEEDGWSPLGSVISPPRPSSWTADDDLPPQPAAGVADEEYWWQGPPPLPRPLVSLWQLEDERVVVAPADEAYRWQGPPPPPPPIVTVWAIDDEIVPPAGTISVSEEYWWSAPPWPARTSLPFTDDEILPAASAITDDNYWWRAQWITPPLAAQPLADDETLPIAAVVVTPDDPYWWTPAPAAPRPLALVWSVEDERVPVAPADEAYWWVKPQPWPLPWVTVWRAVDVEIGPPPVGASQPIVFVSPRRPLIFTAPAAPTLAMAPMRALLSDGTSGNRLSALNQSPASGNAQTLGLWFYLLTIDSDNDFILQWSETSFVTARMNLAMQLVVRVQGTTPPQAIATLSLNRWYFLAVVREDTDTFRWYLGDEATPPSLLHSVDDAVSDQSSLWDVHLGSTSPNQATHARFAELTHYTTAQDLAGVQAIWARRGNPTNLNLWSYNRFQGLGDLVGAAGTSPYTFSQVGAGWSTAEGLRMVGRAFIVAAPGRSLIFRSPRRKGDG